MIPEAEGEQNALNDEYDRLRRYRPNENSRYFQIKKDVLNNAVHLRDGRRLLIDAFRNRILPLRDPAFYPQYHDDSSSNLSDSDDENNGNNGNNDNGNNGNNGNGNNGNNGGNNGNNGGNNGNNGNNDGNKDVNNKSQTSSKSKKVTIPASIKSNTIYNYFFEKSLKDIENKLRNYKKDPKTKKSYDGMVKRLSVGLEKLRKDKNKLPKCEDKFLLGLIEKTIESLIEGTSDIPEGKVEIQHTPPKYYKKEGKGLKILTPNQLINRLPILLAQKKAGNNSQKLNNEIRQIIYSLYQSKNMSKTIYNHLINIL